MVKRRWGRPARASGQRGLTLTELLVVAAIMGLGAAVVPKMMIDLVRFTNRNTTQIEVQREARIAMDEMLRLLRTARRASIDIKSPAGQPPFSKIKFTGGDDRVYLIYQSGSQLLIGPEMGTKRIYSNNLVWCSFFNTQGTSFNTVTVSISLSKATIKPLSDSTILLTETVAPLN